jgi:hypothetical protein
MADFSAFPVMAVSLYVPLRQGTLKVAWDESTVNVIAQSFTVDANKDVTHWTARKIKEQW